ncbi:MAG TPA: hypothetical protein VJQ08_03315 [Candidatus Dormibacteraeota bacterium]|nr:hypothetical protein [Candidatus Dormibacteraeota bacterium]
MKRVVLAVALAAGILFASAASASAAATFCDWDPLVLIVTPGGHIEPVYDSVWTSSLLDLGLPTESYTVARGYRSGKPVTNVNMTIYVPTGLLLKYATYDEVTTGLLGSGKVLASGSGYSGAPVHLRFTLDTP